MSKPQIKVEKIFKESVDKLNSMLLDLDNLLGTKSTSKENKKEEEKKEQIPIIGGVLNYIEKEEEKKKEKKPKKEKIIKETKQSKKGLDKNEIFKLCDLRVGKITSIKIMEGFNDIYELDIDLNEGKIRKIGTGLRHYIPMEKIENSKVIVFSNLKPKRFGKNFESNGMIMCASQKENDKEVFELIRPNENSNPGDKVYLEGTELDKSVVQQITGGYYKKAIINFKTDDNCICMYNGIKLRTESGFVTVESLKNSDIS